MKSIFTFLFCIASLSVTAQTAFYPNAPATRLKTTGVTVFNPPVASGGGGTSLNAVCVQTNVVFNSGGTATASLSNGTTAGNSLIVFVSQLFVTVGKLPTSCTSSGNTYYQCGIYSNSAIAIQPGIVAFIATNIAGGSVTVSISGGSDNFNSYRLITIEEISGIHGVQSFVAADASGHTVSLPFTASKQFAINCLDYNNNSYPPVSGSSFSSVPWTLLGNFTGYANSDESFGVWLNPTTGYAAGSGTITLTTTGSNGDAAMALILQ